MAVNKSQLTLRLSEMDLVKIRKIATVENRSVNNMIETSIKRTIKQYESENGEIEISEDDLGLE